VLGTRHLLQAGVELAHSTRAITRAGTAVDLLHAATCAGAVAFLPAWRRAALVDGTGAVVFATGGLTRARLTSIGAPSPGGAPSSRSA
jgi:hypothetical protein